MQHNLDDIGGARELAWHRISVANDDLEAAEMNYYLMTIWREVFMRGKLLMKIGVLGNFSAR